MSEEDNEFFDIFSEIRGLFNSDIAFPVVKDVIKAFLAKHFAGFEITPDYGIQVSENDFIELTKGRSAEKDISEVEKDRHKVYEKEYDFYVGCENISGAACDYVIKRLHVKYFVERQDNKRVYTITYIAGFTVIESPEIYLVKGKPESPK